MSNYTIQIFLDKGNCFKKQYMVNIINKFPSFINLTFSRLLVLYNNVYLLLIVSILFLLKIYFFRSFNPLIFKLIEFEKDIFLVYTVIITILFKNKNSMVYGRLSTFNFKLNFLTLEVEL